MKVLAFSDLHLSQSHARALVTASQKADLVIGAGDFCNMRQGLEEAMDLLKGIPAPFVVVPGNAESAEELRQAVHSGTTVLHGEGTKVAGLELFGLGYGVPTTPFGNWSCDLPETEAETMLNRCETADILILHSPPKGFCDVTSTGHSVGSTAIRDAITRVQPQWAFCGHIHDSWGQTERLGRTSVVNLGPSANWFNITPND